MKPLAVSTFLLSLPAASLADAPRVATDIAPVHSLVSMVMEGVGTPDLLIPAAASPHGYAFRPSDARALQEADILVWVGPALTPWLGESLETIGPDAVSLALMEVAGTTLLPVRDGTVLDLSVGEDHGHGDGHDDHGHDDHGHDDHGHDEHGQDEHARDDHGDDDHGHDDHGSTDHAHDDHGHGDHAHAGGNDPHVWLSPANADVWLDRIAGDLSAIDPENADTYRANAEAAKDRLDLLTTEIAEQLRDSASQGFAVYHDAFQYFEAYFGLQAGRALSETDGAQPSAARAAAFRDGIASGAITCVFAEPQFADSALRSVAGDAPIAVLDPIGSTLEPGPDLYPSMLLALAGGIADC